MMDDDLALKGDLEITTLAIQNISKTAPGSIGYWFAKLAEEIERLHITRDLQETELANDIIEEELSND